MSHNRNERAPNGGAKHRSDRAGFNHGDAPADGSFAASAASPGMMLT